MRLWVRIGNIGKRIGSKRMQKKVKLIVGENSSNAYVF